MSKESKQDQQNTNEDNYGMFTGKKPYKRTVLFNGGDTEKETSHADVDISWKHSAEILKDLPKVERILMSAIHWDTGVQHIHQPINIESGFVVTGFRHSNCLATLASAGAAILDIEEFPIDKVMGKDRNEIQTQDIRMGTLLEEEFFERGWSVPDAAEKLNIGVGTLRNIMNGTLPIGITLAADLGKLFGVSKFLFLDKLDFNKYVKSHRRRLADVGIFDSAEQHIRSLLIRRFSSRIETQGFVTNKNRFVDRKEAMEIAREAGQFLHGESAYTQGGDLFSEDLW